MCSIVGSFNAKEAKALCEANYYRGSLNHSISYIDINSNTIEVNRYKGSLDLDKIMSYKDKYIIVHQQAPTQNSSFIHPAEFNSSYLWHNGLLKFDCVQKFKSKYKDENDWDTYYILKELQNLNFKELDGSYACLYFRDNLYMFRNNLAPLYVDDKMNISSTQFNGSISLKSERFFRVNLQRKKLIEILQFETIETPYFFG